MYKTEALIVTLATICRRNLFGLLVFTIILYIFVILEGHGNIKITDAMAFCFAKSR